MCEMAILYKFYSPQHLNHTRIHRRLLKASFNHALMLS
jgi:hypothetical protein